MKQEDAPSAGAVAERGDSHFLSLAAVSLDQRLAVMADNATLGLLMMDERQHCVFMNRAAEEITGYAFAEVKEFDRPLHDIIHHTRPDGRPYPMSECPIDRALPQNNREHGEDLFVHKGGWFYPVAFTASPIRDGQGRPVGTVIELKGTAEEKQAAQERAHLINELEQAKAAAESASRAKDEFLAMLGHELRNPLAPILTALQLMKLRSAHSFERERAVIDRQVRHVMHLVDDLLDISRITRGKLTIDPVDIELSDLVSRAVEVASPVLETRSHRLEVNVPTGLRVHADVMRITQVISNLLTNAARYTPAEGKITIAADGDDDLIRLRVRDNGLGIQKEMLNRIFELFVQERQAIDRATGGLGLGLAIVRALVSLHGGTVAARSDGLGQGSEFEVILPTHQAAVRAQRPSSPIIATQGNSDRRQILVVDDNRDAAELLAEALTDLGHVVRIAYDGPEALERLGEFLPHVAFVDIGLPVMDGYELARRIRNNPGLRSIRLVAITGYGLQADRDQTKEAGFDAHHVKPVDLSTVEREALLSKPESPL